MKKFSDKFTTKFVTMLLVVFVLSGCTKYSIYDNTQYYQKLSEGTGYRVNPYGYEFCFEDLDGVSIDCVKLIDNYKLEGDYFILESQENFSIVRDEQNLLYMVLPTGLAVQMLFGQYNSYYVLLQNETAKISLVFDKEHNHILIGDDPNDTMHFERIGGIFY